MDAVSVANHRVAFRPVRGGTLIFQPDNQQSGTLGLVVTSDGVDQWLLTARHVLTRTNGALVPTDTILQPDAGPGPVATLANARQDALRDCAAAQLGVPGSREVLGLGPLTAAVPPAVGMRVVKSSWRTGVSEGRIQQVNGDEVIIERLPGFSFAYLLAAPGDSGAVWVEATTRAPVAIHTREAAVGPHVALATNFTAVLTSLGLSQI